MSGLSRKSSSRPHEHVHAEGGKDENDEWDDADDEEEDDNDAEPNSPAALPSSIPVCASGHDSISPTMASTPLSAIILSRKSIYSQRV